MSVLLQRSLASLALAAVLVGCACTKAGAQESTAEDTCVNAPDDQALRDCRASDLDAATTELRSVASALSQSLAEGLDGNAEALAEAQTDWERFMRSECRLINFESLSGTAGDIYEMDCLSTMTRARTRQLQEMLDSP